MRSEKNFRAAVVRGAIAGLAGAIAMTPMILMMRAVGITREPFPDIATRGVLRETGLLSSVGKGGSGVLAWTSHLLYGATFGAIFGGLKSRVDLPAMPSGPIYGLAVYALGFLGWLPALGIIPPLQKEREPAGVMRMMGHIMYGAVVGAVYDRDRRIAGRLQRTAEETPRVIREPDNLPA